jgi:hypothetical protein
MYVRVSGKTLSTTIYHASIDPPPSEEAQADGEHIQSPSPPLLCVPQIGQVIQRSRECAGIREWSCRFLSEVVAGLDRSLLLSNERLERSWRFCDRS